MRRPPSIPPLRALVTGASSGIGAAFAAALPEATGLLLHGRDGDRLADAAAAAARPGRLVETHAGDLADAAQLDALADHAERFGIDLLVNNAGVGRFGRFLDNPVEAEEATVRVNVLAVVGLTRRLLPGMIARARAADRRAGLIIVASSAAFAPMPYFATYAASKGFDLQFAEALAEELRGEPVDVLALCPGATRTGFGRAAGFELGSLPGAADPLAVARQGLDALGHERVRFTSRVDQAALAPFVLPRRAIAGALGAALKLLQPARRRP